MTTRVSTKLQTVVADPMTQELDFRVTADLPVRELLRQVQTALADFTDRWDTDEPVELGNEPAAAPDTMASTAAPDVVVSVVKISDVPVTFERLVAAINDAVPVRCRLDTVKPIRLPVRGPVAMLNLRLALNGHRDGRFHLDVDLDSIEQACVEWLRELPVNTPMLIEAPNYRHIPVAAGAELDTLREYRQYKQTCLITARGDQFRAVGYWLPEAWFSLMAGTTAPHTFDWREQWTVIEPLFRRLEPDTHTAVVCHSTDFGARANGLHGYRQLRPHAANTFVARALEQDGLVDADGRFYTSQPPTGIPDTWTQTRYGHLTQTDAPDLEAWLAQPPDTDTLHHGRVDLARLLAQDTSIESGIGR